MFFVRTKSERKNVWRLPNMNYFQKIIAIKGSYGVGNLGDASCSIYDNKEST